MTSTNDPNPTDDFLTNWEIIRGLRGEPLDLPEWKSAMVEVAANRISEQANEIARLQNTLKDLGESHKRLRKALEAIAEPLKYIHGVAVADENVSLRLNIDPYYASMLASSGEFLSGIAIKALAAWRKE